MKGYKGMVTNKITSRKKIQAPIGKQMVKGKQVLIGKKTSEGGQEPKGKQELEEKPKLEEQQKQKENFSIVGIGASAGGLGAFEAFFSGIPKKVNPGVAFVIVQHLDPKYKSILTSLIGRATQTCKFTR